MVMRKRKEKEASRMSKSEGYFINQELLEEMRRLHEQDALVTEVMGGVLPERPDFQEIHDVLDIACGSAGWCLSIAKQHPNVRVVGIDLSHRMIDFDRKQVQAEGLANATFHEMDATKPLEFPDASFDLVNGRLLFGFLTPSQWPLLLRECLRVLRPGGMLRMTEGEAPISTSSAYNALNRLVVQAQKRKGQSFSPDGYLTTITPLLRRLFVAAGCTDVHQHAYIIDFSADTPAHAPWYETLKVAFQLFQPFLLDVGVTTQEELDRLYPQMLQEMLDPSFSSVIFLLTVWSLKQ